MTHIRKIAFRKVAPLILLTVFGCDKEEPIITENYIGNFFGFYYSSDTTEFNELGVSLTIIENGNSQLLINDLCAIAISNDSIQGVVIIPNAEYLFHPHVVGHWSKPDGKNYHLVGEYVAMKDSVHGITGTFEIVPDL